MTKDERNDNNKIKLKKSMKVKASQDLNFRLM